MTCVLAEGVRLFSACSTATSVGNCCALATAARATELCLFNEEVDQLSWAQACCRSSSLSAPWNRTTCQGVTCEWFIPPICCPGGGGLIFPLFGEDEQMWHNSLRIFLYIAGFLWLFLAVALASDVFMEGVEAITSSTRDVLVVVDGIQKTISTPIWNESVANLSLMALGSSAPEILLSLIEIMVNKFYAGSLGPGTILGSAAFNMFIITGICISSFPNGDSRYIKNVNVFCLTAFFSVFAYLWVVFILEGASPARIEIWEGLLTFFFFILLLVLSYLTTIGKISFIPRFLASPSLPQAEIALYGRAVPVLSPASYPMGKCAPIIQEVRNMNIQDSGSQEVENDQDMAQRVSARLSAIEKRKSRAQYRSEVLKKVSGRGQFLGIKAERTEDNALWASFSSATAICNERDGQIQLDLILSQGCSECVEIPYKTIDGTAIHDQDYIPTDAVCKIRAGERSATISIAIINDDKCEGEEYFFVQLETPRTGGYILGAHSSARITITDDDVGSLMFGTQRHTRDQVLVNVIRDHVSCVAISCKYHTLPLTAVADIDYATTDGTLLFPKGIQQQTIAIPIYGGNPQSTVKLVLDHPTKGVSFLGDGTKERIEAIITLSPQVSWCAVYRDQFMQTLYPSDPTALDWALHVISFPIKIVLAFVPSATFCQGWLCFLGALAVISVLTALINDISSLVGCALGIPDSITAITFVALGTSVPDTFASQLAAVSDNHADASLGNITGSNSINVFLGLGISWSIAAFYWSYQTDPVILVERFSRYANRVSADALATNSFIVPAGTFTLNVVLFLCCNVLALALLGWRRNHCGGELGGPIRQQRISSAILFAMWVLYVVVSSILSVNEDQRRR